MLIFDSHLDLALNAVDWNRDIRMAVAEITSEYADAILPTDPIAGPPGRHYPYTRPCRPSGVALAGLARFSGR